ncbi:glycosyltransferase family 4 protein [soil metagenome]
MAEKIPTPRKWIVTQIGARQHYAAARGFLAQGRLTQFYTDIWARRSNSVLRRLPGPWPALAGRFHDAFPPSRVTSFSVGGMARLYQFRRTRTTETAYESFMKTGEWFCGKVNRSLGVRDLNPAEHAAFLFNTGALETIEYLRPRGVPCLLDQIEPARVEEDVTLEECKKWPDWQKSPGRIPEAYFNRLSREWAAADVVMVNSSWTQRALVQQGVAAEKIAIVPQAYESEFPAGPIERKRKPGTPLQVLWIGQVILRKGIPYLFEAAKQLLNENIQFAVAGWVGINAPALQTAPANVRIIGPVPRAQTPNLYRAADVFVLPTMSDGFAITQLEAMSFGLPVIATERCGDVVSDGVDGTIIPAGDSNALAAAIYLLYREPDRLAAYSRAAIDKAGQFSLSRFVDGVDATLATGLRRRTGA